LFSCEFGFMLIDMTGFSICGSPPPSPPPLSLMLFRKCSRTSFLHFIPVTRQPQQFFAKTRLFPFPRIRGPDCPPPCPFFSKPLFWRLFFFIAPSNSETPETSDVCFWWGFGGWGVGGLVCVGGGFWGGGLFWV